MRDSQTVDADDGVSSQSDRPAAASRPADSSAAADGDVDAGEVASDAPDTSGSSDSSNAPDESGRRDVVVPLRLYKTITVFSTLIAALSILTGFILLDAATLEVSVLRGVIVSVIGLGGITPDQSLLSGLLGVAGLSLMALGSGVFILSSRFRAEGMGNAQEDTDEESTNG